MPQNPFYFSLSNENTKTLSQYNYLDETENLRANANNQVGRTFVDFDNNISVKSSYDRRDFEYFRQNTSNLNPIERINLAEKAYKKVGIIRNIIDIMANLTCQGIRLQHRNRKDERFFQAWFNAINGEHVAERFANMLYRVGNVPVLTAYGKIKMAVQEEMCKSVATGMHDAELITLPPIVAREIPLKYTFIPPASVEVLGGSASLLVGRQVYALKISSNLLADISKIAGSPNNVLNKEYSLLLQKLQDIRQKNGNYLEIDQNKFEIYYYKKDDWEIWADPIVGAVMDDLIVLERMKLADMSALDGAISNIRHWKVGILDPSNPKNSIIPTKAAINKIKNILANSVGGGTMDLVTGPEVDFKESNTQVHKFLGSEKYKTTLDSIYDGMGIPPPLRGGSSTSSTNNYVSLKTLIEQLAYGRGILTRFLNKQIAIVQKAMGISFPAQVCFDETILSDESAEKKLLIDLLDRDMISQEAVVRYFGFNPEIEKVKIKRDYKNRGKKNVPNKASPFHHPVPEQDYTKLFIQQGVVTPGEVGLELEEKVPDQKIPLELQKKFAPKPVVGPGKKGGKLATKKKKTGNKGRTPGVKETKKRKPKPNQKPRTSASLVLWATDVYNKIHDVLSEPLLNAYAKSNWRKLTKEESEEAEQIKFGILCSLPVLFDDITDEIIQLCLSVDNAIPTYITEKFIELLNDFEIEKSRKATLEETRKLQVLSFVECNSEEE